MRPKVLVTRKLPQQALERLERHCDVDLNGEDRPLTRQELLNRIRDKDGILSMLTDRIDAELMDAAPKLKVISNYAVGFNNIDVKEATRRGIPVTNTPGVLTESTADLTWALIMDVARRVSEGDRVTRAGRWPGWSPMWMLGQDVHGATLGIIGMGRIGKAVARRARGFDMQAIDYSRTRLPEDEEAGAWGLLPSAAGSASAGRFRLPARSLQRRDAPSDRCRGTGHDEIDRLSDQHGARSLGR